VAVVGAGLMGTWHGRYARRAGARVTAVVDRDPEAARRLARRLDAEALAPEAGWAERCGAEVVHVCTPPSSHGELVTALLEAGRHGVVEKPLAEDPDTCRALLDLARDRCLGLTVVHQMPFQRGFRRLLEERHRLGEILRLEHHAFTAGAAGRPVDERRAILRGILPHSLSLFGALGHQPGLADWKVLRNDGDGIELVAHHDGVRLAVLIDAEARPTRNELLVLGSEGSARIDLFHGFVHFVPGRVSRRDKILLPLREAAGQGLGAAFNLLRRALLRQSAYPGLLELLREVYRRPSRSPVDAEEVLAASRLMERLAKETGA
jgi:predicted dehydrogenase